MDFEYMEVPQKHRPSKSMVGTSNGHRISLPKVAKSIPIFGMTLDQFHPLETQLEIVMYPGRIKRAKEYVAL